MQPPGPQYGDMDENGSWNGMIGQIINKVSDQAMPLGPQQALACFLTEPQTFG